MMTDLEARAIVRLAFYAVCGVNYEPSVAACQAVQAICRHESSYGGGWTGAMVGSHNWGATQGRGSAGSAQQSDSHADGTKYVTAFARYANDVDGCAAVVSWLRKRTACWLALETGDAGLLASAMHDGRYFEGRGDAQHSVDGYADALARNAEAIAYGCGEELWLTRNGPLALHLTEDGHIRKS